MGDRTQAKNVVFREVQQTPRLQAYKSFEVHAYKKIFNVKY